MKTVFVTVNGLRTRYLTEGSGKPLVLLHPVGFPADLLTRAITGLSDTYTVIAPDLAGQGYSDPPAVWTAPQVFMADQVIALLDLLGHDRFSLMGTSLGGLVAGMVALRAPKRVENLVIVGSGSTFNDPAKQPEILLKVYHNGAPAYANPSQEACRTRMGNICFRPPEAEDIILTQITAYAYPGAGDNFRNITEGVAATITDPAASVQPHIRQLATRSLIVVGANDIRTSAASHRDAAAQMPDAQFLLIEECGHLPYLERPALFNDVMRRFLAGETVGERTAPRA
jgi:2-hydroxy-6-oxonona-2,4-dienedioate hydrolase